MGVPSRYQDPDDVSKKNFFLGGGVVVPLELIYAAIFKGLKLHPVVFF